LLKYCRLQRSARCPAGRSRVRNGLSLEASSVRKPGTKERDGPSQAHPPVAGGYPNGSEIEPQRQLHDARMATESLLRFIELSGSSFEQAQHCRLRGELYSVYGSRYELRVIEGVVEINTELELLPFRNPEVLED